MTNPASSPAIPPPVGCTWGTTSARSRTVCLGDDRLARFVRALEAAAQFLVNHPEEGWALFIKGRKDLDDELNKRAFRDTLPRFALRPAALDRGRYRRMAQFLKDQGLISKVRAIADYAVELE